MQRNLIILGSSGFAKEVAMLATEINAHSGRWRFLGFVSNNKNEAGKDVGPGEILGDDEWLLNSDIRADLVIGIGYPFLRAVAATEYLRCNDRFDFPNLIHPNAILDTRLVGLGKGNIVTAGCIFTCDIKVGNFNLFNLHTTIGHDVSIENYNVFNPGTNISGGVKIGSKVLVGTGAQILEHRNISDGATIGAGSVVLRDVDPNVTVAGVPAKPLPPKKMG